MAKGIREKISWFLPLVLVLLHHEEQTYQTGKMELKKYDRLYVKARYLQRS